MDLAHCCLADCYFRFRYLPLPLRCICLEEPARRSHLAALINTVHSVRGAYQFPACGLNTSRGRIWLIRGPQLIHFLFFLLRKSILRQRRFICTEINSPPFSCSAITSEEISVVFFMFASAWPRQLVLLNANGGGGADLQGKE